MATQYEIDRIDVQWHAKSPGWRPREYSGEREMLYDILDDQEDIECLLACRWGNNHSWAWVGNVVVGSRECRHIHRHSRFRGNPKAIGSKCVFASYRIPGSRFRGDDGNRRLETDILKLTTLPRGSIQNVGNYYPGSRYDGIAVATSRRVIFLVKRRGFLGFFGEATTATAEMTYEDIVSVPYPNMDLYERRWIDRRMGNLVRVGDYKYTVDRQVDDQPFIDCVRSHLTSPEALKANRLDAQWQACSPDFFDPVDSTRVRRNLYSVLYDNENIERLTGAPMPTGIDLMRRIGEAQEHSTVTNRVKMRQVKSTSKKIRVTGGS